MADKKVLNSIAVVSNIQEAAIVTSILGKWGYYYPLFETPRVGRPDFENEVRRRINLFAVSGLKKLLLVNLDDNICKNFCKLLSPSNVETTSISRVLESCVDSNQDRRILRYRSQDVVSALVLALREDLVLELDATADRINLNNDYESECLVVVENSEFVGSIVAVNYASIYDAHMLTIKSSTREETERLTTLFRSYDEASNPLDKESICSSIRETVGAKIPSMDYSKYKHIIFFTFGMPYGLVFREHACTHFPTYPDSGLFTLKNVLFDGFIRSVLLVDSGGVDSKEDKILRESLANKGAVIKILKAKNSTIQNVDFHLSQVPYNLIIFATHGGFTKGNRLTIEYRDKKNNVSTITIRKDDSFSIIPGTGKVLVQSIVEPEKVNGVVWELAEDKQLKLGWNILENLEQYLENDKAKIIEVEKDVRMSHSNSIKLSDGNYFVSFVETGDKRGPVVINNICGSAQLMPINFLYGGTRVYIGTLTSVLDSVANDFAEKILNSELPLSEIISEFNKQHFGESSIGGYVLYGSHNYKLQVKDDHNVNFFCDEIHECIERIERFLESNPFYLEPERPRLIIKRLNKELKELLVAERP